MSRSLLSLIAVLLLAFCCNAVARAAPTPVALRGGVVLNELLVDPNGSSNYDTDGNGTAAATDEFVELYNGGGAAVDLAGLELWDPGAGVWFVFPQGALLAGGSYAVVVAGVQSGGALPVLPAGHLAFDAGRGSGVINNGGDNVVLYDPAADSYIQLWVAAAAVDPTVTGDGLFEGFSNTAAAAAPGEDFGVDRDGVSRTREPAGDQRVVHHDDISAANASPGTAPPAMLAVSLHTLRTTAPPPMRAQVVLSGLLLFSSCCLLRLRHSRRRPANSFR